MTAPAPRIPPGPPFDLNVVADVHAGVYPNDVARELRTRIAADPAARALLAALDATVADLHNAPSIPIPEQASGRLDAVIAAESAARASGRRRPDGGADQPGLTLASAPESQPLGYRPAAGGSAVHGSPTTRRCGCDGPVPGNAGR